MLTSSPGSFIITIPPIVKLQQKRACARTYGKIALTSINFKFRHFSQGATT
jgi:hypothetical protein